ncbi:hypothetical protein [Burkholderia multivorans]|uniref:hypothetical protein n=1 Tax=Burkholderia multivorans TaxID=87883 RepID=UPI0021595495|nr:hypothetical protein [Burkholderia multivorans]
MTHHPSRSRRMVRGIHVRRPLPVHRCVRHARITVGRPAAHRVDACAAERKTPLWAESGVVGSAAAPGDAGEALVGQTSSSGVRLSDFAYYISLRSYRRFFMQSSRRTPTLSPRLSRKPPRSRSPSVAAPSAVFFFATSRRVFVSTT